MLWLKHISGSVMQGKRSSELVTLQKFDGIFHTLPIPNIIFVKKPIIPNGNYSKVLYLGISQKGYHFQQTIYFLVQSVKPLRQGEKFEGNLQRAILGQEFAQYFQKTKMMAQKNLQAQFQYQKQNIWSDQSPHCFQTFENQYRRIQSLNPNILPQKIALQYRECGRFTTLRFSIDLISSISKKCSKENFFDIAIVKIQVAQLNNQNYINLRGIYGLGQVQPILSFDDWLNSATKGQLQNESSQQTIFTFLMRSMASNINQGFQNATRFLV
ncbi:unnamed protein product [Paramecium octaurelia]|uniref:Uncharacterized protein n=1 Tax=Paramecium octaurelia TaxID=43137 RepID=A0A8S1THP6_PAROT|nr:unnamed protein product [Paramecium octaurelia]